MNAKSNYLKYIAIALAVILVITASLIFLDLWEKRHSEFPVINDEGTVTHLDKEYQKKSDLETFLVMGLDKYQGETTADSHESGVQADFLMLFVFDNQKEQVRAIHINRDTITKVNKLSVGGTSVVDSFNTQIALAYNYVNDDNDKIRCRNVKESVEYLLKDIEIKHYLSLDMDFVPAVTDAVGGVQVTVLDDFGNIDETLIKGQQVTLQGEQALTYVRTRYGLEDSTNTTRMDRQQQFIEELYKKITACSQEDETYLPRLVGQVDDHVVYDSSDKKMIKFAEKFNSFEFLGITDIEGEIKVAEGFAEFHPNEESIWEIVLDVFYKIKE